MNGWLCIQDKDKIYGTVGSDSVEAKIVVEARIGSVLDGCEPIVVFIFRGGGIKKRSKRTGLLLSNFVNKKLLTKSC